MASTATPERRNAGTPRSVTRVLDEADLAGAVELAARHDGELLMETLATGNVPSAS